VSGVSVLAVSWWCQATRAPWNWTPKLYVGVWIMMALILGSYGWAMRRRARAVGLDHRDKRAILWFVLGTLGLWLATDWPLGLLGSGYLLSIHTTLYLVYTMVAAPLMLIGIPPWMARSMLDRLHGWGAYRWMMKPWIAAVVLNGALVFTHLPFVVDPFRSSQFGSFVLDAIWLVSGVVGWLPVISPFRGDRIQSPMWKCVYLFIAFGAFPMLPGAFITFSPLPLFRVYELAPRFGDWSPEDDQQLAGALMKVGNIPILWAVIGTIFVKTLLQQNNDERRLGEVDDDGNRVPLTPPAPQPPTAPVS
jgi:cytochrome c oxidase assembly factor CtaG